MNKPFDLQKALAGEPVFTEGDTGHYQFTLAGNSKSDEHRHVFKMKAHDEQEPHEYIIISDDFGDVISGYTGQDFDNLTMAPVRKTVWVNMYDWAGRMAVGKSETYESEEEAKKAAGTGTPSYLGTYPIEIEL